MRIPKKLESVIDTGGLIVALVVDVVINFICFLTLSPDIVTAVAFVSIGIMCVLFVFRAWSKGQVIPWLVFVSVVFFFDYSFALVTTKIQSEKKASNVYDNQEVKNIDTAIAKNDETLSILRAQYDKAMKRETLEEINAQIENETKAKEQNITERKTLILELKKSEKIESGITAQAVFDAIPTAWREKRYSALIIFGLICLGMQMVVVISIDNDIFKKKAEKKSDREVKHLFDEKDFVRMLYYGVDLGKPFIPQDDIMAKYCQIAGIEWDDAAREIYNKCLSVLLKNGFIGERNNIIKKRAEAEKLILEDKNVRGS